MFARTLIAAALVVGSASAAIAGGRPATAARGDAAPTRTVKVADLDLSRPAGMATLEQRIRYSVAAVCGRGNPVGLAAASRLAQCRSDAVADAKRQVAALVGKVQYAGRADISAR